MEVGGNFSYRIADEDYTDYASFKQAVQLNPTFSVDEMDHSKVIVIPLILSKI